MTHEIIHRGKHYTFDYVANKSLSIKDAEGKLTNEKHVLNAVCVEIRCLCLDYYVDKG